MRYLLDGQDIGMFGPEDLERLTAAYLSLSHARSVGENEEEGRRLARSIIQLYRHGVRDTDQLVAALRLDSSAA